MKDKDMQEKNLFLKRRLLTVAVATALVAMTGCGGSSDSETTTDTSIADQTVPVAGEINSAIDNVADTVATAAVTVTARAAVSGDAAVTVVFEDEEYDEELIGNLVITVRSKTDGSVVTTTSSASNGVASLELETGEYGVWAEDPNGVYAPSFCNLSVDTDASTEAECSIVLTGAPAIATFDPFSTNEADRTITGSDLGLDEGLKLVFPAPLSDTRSAFYFEELTQAVVESPDRVDLNTIEYLEDTNARVTVAVRLVNLGEGNNSSIFPGSETTPNQEQLGQLLGENTGFVDINGNVIDEADLGVFKVSSSTMLIVAMTYDGRRLEPVPGNPIVSTTPLFGAKEGGDFKVGDVISSTHLAGGDLSWASEATGEVVSCEGGSYDLCATYEVPRFCSYLAVDNGYNQLSFVSTIKVSEKGETYCLQDVEDDQQPDACIEYQVSFSQEQPVDALIAGSEHLSSTDELYESSGINGGVPYTAQQALAFFPDGSTPRRNGASQFDASKPGQRFYSYTVPGRNSNSDRNRFYFYTSNIWQNNAEASLTKIDSDSVGSNELGDGIVVNFPIALAKSNRCAAANLTGVNDCADLNATIIDERWIVTATLEAKPKNADDTAWVVVGTQTIDNIDDGDAEQATIDATPLESLQIWNFEITVENGSVFLKLDEDINSGHNSVSYPVQVVAPQ